MTSHDHISYVDVREVLHAPTAAAAAAAAAPL
jgi:hypothetical protein